MPKSGPSSPPVRRWPPRPAAAATSWRDAPRSSRSTGSAPAWLPASRPAPPAARRDCWPRLRPPSVSLVRAVRAVRAPSSSESAEVPGWEGEGLSSALDWQAGQLLADCERSMQSAQHPSQLAAQVLPSQRLKLWIAPEKTSSFHSLRRAVRAAVVARDFRLRVSSASSTSICKWQCEVRMVGQGSRSCATCMQEPRAGSPTVCGPAGNSQHVQLTGRAAWVLSIPSKSPCSTETARSKPYLAARLAAPPLLAVVLLADVA